MSRVLRHAGLVGVVAIALTAWLSAGAPAPVADAAMKHETEAVRTLLKNGEDVNAAQGDGMTALHWAARNGDAELTQMLLYAGANVKATTRLGDRKSTRLNSSHGYISYAVFCLKKKNQRPTQAVEGSEQ